MGIWNNLFGRGAGDVQAGCGFLDTREIEAGLVGELSAGRTQAFADHQLTGCNACALLAADIEVFAAVAASGPVETERREFEHSAAGLRARLRQELAARDGAQRSRNRFNWTIAPGLALAALLMLAVMLPNLLSDDPTELSLGGGLTHKIEPLPELPITRGAEALLQRANEAYVAGNYEDAARLFAEVEQLEPQHHDAVLYRGVSLLIAGERGEALEVLRRARALADEQGLLGALDDWWLGQAAVAAGDLELAREALTRAVATDSSVAPQAQQLLDKLSSSGN